jgi:MFS family permease
VFVAAEVYVEQSGDNVINIVVLVFIGIALLIIPALPSLLRDWYPDRPRSHYVAFTVAVAIGLLLFGTIALLQLLAVIPYRGEGKPVG